MPDQAAIADQQELLAKHRRTLAHYLKQQADLGSAYAPPGIANGIDDERANIRRAKAALRLWGVDVEDHPDDLPPASAVFPRRLPPILRRLGITVLSLCLLAAGGGLVFTLVQNVPAPPGQGAAQTSAAAATAAEPPHTAATPPPAQPSSVPLVVSIGPGCEQLGLAGAISPVAEPTQPAGAGDPAVLRIGFVCAGAVITATMPAPLLRPNEFLAEAAVLPATIAPDYRATWLAGLVGYASANYTGALARLDEISPFVAQPALDLVRAQAWMQLEQWDQAREAYEQALAAGPAPTPALRAQAHAGVGLAYILAAQRGGFVSKPSQQDCQAHAYDEFDAAVRAQPDRALWWLGRALARIKCVTPQDYAAIRSDIEQARQLAQASPASDRALALSMAALAAIDFQEVPDLSLAAGLAQQAQQRAPSQSLAYHLLSCISHRRGRDDDARSFYRQYQAGLVWQWDRERAAADGARGEYCIL